MQARGSPEAGPHAVLLPDPFFTEQTGCFRFCPWGKAIL